MLDAEALLKGITGKRTRYFRFPAGNHDDRSLATVEALGYRVVHWSFASGDPVKSLTPEHESEWVPGKKPSPATFSSSTHGRGWSTGKALPGIVATLRDRGYRFARGWTRCCRDRI